MHSLPVRRRVTPSEASHISGDVYQSLRQPSGQQVVTPVPAGLLRDLRASPSLPVRQQGIPSKDFREAGHLPRRPPQPSSLVPGRELERYQPPDSSSVQMRIEAKIAEMKQNKIDIETLKHQLQLKKDNIERLLAKRNEYQIKLNTLEKEMIKLEAEISTLEAEAKKQALEEAEQEMKKSD